MGTGKTAATDGSEASAQRVRELCLALPAVEERLSHGEPTWFVGGNKTFVMFPDRHHDDRVAIWCAAGPGVQES